MKALLLSVVCLVAAAGCAGGDGTTTAGTAGGTDSARAAYIAKADAACRGFGENHPELARSVAKLQGMTEDDPDLIPALAKHYALVLKLAKEFQTEFAQIAPPPDDRPTIDRLNSANQQAIAELEKIVQRLEAGGKPGAGFDEYVAKLTDANDIAQQYGFDVCSRNAA
jgi:hypothetical protein